jgi:hypothetical protein
MTDHRGRAESSTTPGPGRKASSSRRLVATPACRERPVLRWYPPSKRISPMSHIPTATSIARRPGHVGRSTDDTAQRHPERSRRAMSAVSISFCMSLRHRAAAITGR